MKIDKKYLLILLLLIILGSFLRIEGFINLHKYTFDEVVYTHLSNQLKHNPFNYTSKPIYDDCTKKGRWLPPYLNKPLFKHPPLYCYLGSITQRLINKPYLATYIPSLIFGLALIPLTFFMGYYLFNKETGILAAFLITFEPISGLCSQKIWLETSLVFFMSLAVFYLIKAVVDEKEKYFVWAALASGLASLFKTTGVLTVLFAITVVAIYKPIMLKRKFFKLYILIFFLLNLPWMIWNCIIYKGEFLYSLITIQGELTYNFYPYLISLIILILILFMCIKHQRSIANKAKRSHPIKTQTIITAIIILIFMTPYMLKGVLHSLNFTYIPSTGWRCGFFHGEPPLFYFRRLIELSPFYLIPIWGVVFFNKLEVKQRLLYIWIFISIGLFILHGNYQSRYILPAVPALLILASNFILSLINRINNYYKTEQFKRIFFISAYILLLIYFFLKTLYININLIIPNNIGYI